MWTDGRYFLQATMQMDGNWMLMKMGNQFINSTNMSFTFIHSSFLNNTNLMCEQMSYFAVLGEAGTPTQAEWLAQVMRLLTIAGSLNQAPSPKELRVNSP